MFTLPRRTPWHLHPDGRACPECSHEAGRTDGAPTPPQSLYSVPEAAKLLLEIGRGTSLRAASRALRIENDRWSMDDAGRRFRSRQNALAADYVDRYEPVIAAASRPRRWPRFLILDSTPLYMRVREAERLGLPYKTEGAAVLAAAGTDDPQLPAHAWHVALSGNETGSVWFDFLDSIPTEEPPEWVVADDAGAIHNAVAAKWPTAVIYPCVYHLGERGKLAAQADGLLFSDPAIGPALDTCLRSTHDWERLRMLAKPHAGGALWTWIEENDAKARSLEPLRRRFPAGAPESNGAAEWVVGEIARRIGKRKRNFLNAGRLATIVELMRAELAGVASARHYIRVLRTAQEAAAWQLGAAEDPTWRARHDPSTAVNSMTRLILEGKERAKLDITDLARDSQARSVTRKLTAANEERVALGLAPMEISTRGAVPSAKMPKGTKLTDFPQLMREWDPDNERDPATITHGSGYRAKWICSRCGYHWDAVVGQRTLRGSGCRVCHRRWATPETSLAALHPQLVSAEWAEAENLPLDPARISPRYGHAVLWRCRTYPDLHPLYGMSPRARVKRANADTEACLECRRMARAQKGRRIRASLPLIIDPTEDQPF